MSCRWVQAVYNPPPGPETAPSTAGADNESAPPARKPARRRRAAKAAKKSEAMPAGEQGDPEAKATPKKRTPRPRTRKPQPKTEANIVAPEMTPPAEPPVPGLAAAAPGEGVTASADASKATVINVELSPPPASKASARKGWWQRLSE